MRQEGWTWVEVLIVIVILAIIAVIAVPAFMRCKNIQHKKATADEVAVPSQSVQYNKCLDGCQERFNQEGPLTACVEGCATIHEGSP